PGVLAADLRVPRRAVERGRAEGRGLSLPRLLRHAARADERWRRPVGSSAHRDPLLPPPGKLPEALLAGYRRAAGRPAGFASGSPAAVSAAPPFLCPYCRGELAAAKDAQSCAACGRRYPVLFGIPDLRLSGDRYLDLDADRARAEELDRAATQGARFDELLEL